ncbi:MAG: hypothetical protein EZS28_028955 [Streblomastix strix]|uniref:Uncharacterized protein n=1 Tax=Streblomastix strix TaxID=222440 RepID=A0A5J4UYL5_9EUKA|nr:MAG: hypothetical protein EZS28_028955 [Streblomastix strix]
MMTCWGDCQQYTPSCKDQCDLNLSPVQSRRKIIELHAAMEIDRPERYNIKRHCSYLERPRQCAQPRSLETQDRVQGRLRSKHVHIQDYLVRAGRRRYNLCPGLFRKVLDSNLCDPNEERRLAQDPGLSNSEQRVANKVFQARGDNRYSGNNNVQRLSHNNRPASSLPTHQCSRRDATVSMLQLQCNSGGQEEMQPENLHSTRSWKDTRNRQKPDQSYADSGVLGLAVEHENNNNVNDNIPKERSVEAIKTFDKTSEEKETRKNKGLGIGNWRDPIHKSTI